MRVYKIASVSLAIFVIGVLFAGVAAVPTGAQYGTIQFHYNAQHTGDYSPVAGSNALSGKLTWSFTTGAAVLSSPAVANGTVYVGSDDNNTYALNANNGTKLWSFTTGNEVLSSPAVANGVVYVGSEDSSLYALNATTGKVTWNYTTGNEVLSSPAVANGTVYVGSYDDNAYAIGNAAPATGSTPALEVGLVFVGLVFVGLVIAAYVVRRRG
jgi:hypothetical protein